MNEAVALMKKDVKRVVATPLIAYSIGGGGSTWLAFRAASSAAFAATVRASVRAIGKALKKAIETALDAIASAGIKFAFGFVLKAVAPVLLPVFALIFSPIASPSSIRAALREEEGPKWSSPRCPLVRTAPSSKAGETIPRSVTVPVDALATWGAGRLELKAPNLGWAWAVPMPA